MKRGPASIITDYIEGLKGMCHLNCLVLYILKSISSSNWFFFPDEHPSKRAQTTGLRESASEVKDLLQEHQGRICRPLQDHAQ